MSYYGSKKEFILALYQKKFKVVLEQLIHSSLSHIELERTVTKARIDYAAFLPEKKAEFLLEIQRGRSDDNHLQKVLNYLDLISEGIVMWQAAEFCPSYLEAVSNALLHSGKPVDFYAVSVSEEGLMLLDRLNALPPLKVWEQLDQLRHVDDLFTVTSTIKKMPASYVGHASPINRTEDEIAEQNQQLMKLLQKKIPYYINFHRGKSNLHHRILTVGGGQNDVQYFFSLADRRNVAFISLRFERHSRPIYDHLKPKEDFFRKKIHPRLKMSQGEIIVSFQPSKDYLQTARQLVEVFQRMIDVITPFTHPAQIGGYDCEPDRLVVLLS